MQRPGGRDRDAAILPLYELVGDGETHSCAFYLIAACGLPGRAIANGVKVAKVAIRAISGSSFIGRVR
jgi:hypothetical protein